MANLAVLLYFNGRWDSNNKYINYLADGVLINIDSTFASLVSVIAGQLSIDTSTSKVEIRYKIDESYSIQCLGENCSWNLRASSVNKSQMFAIRDFESEHTCLLLHNSLSERQATKTVVGSIIVAKCIDPDANYTPRDIQNDMLQEYGVRLTYMQAWRDKEKALELVRDDPAQSYAKLPSYFRILEATYPGSYIRLHKSEDDHFLYAFVALFTSIKGWEYCRPIVVVDGTFLKGVYKGTMLTANTLDAVGSILPLAYAIVDSENDASWRWFFEQFKKAFGQRSEMCIISDRHASIIKATSTVYNEIPHFACIWHLLQNIMKNFRKSQQKVTELFYSMAKTYTTVEFNQYMEIIEKINKRIKYYLLNIGYNKWSRVHAQVRETNEYVYTVLDGITPFTLLGSSSDGALHIRVFQPVV
ncbi:uncharacterized protein LOC129894621 [Solanum dulcamara]|uniref:uncharacterized protein LOC129894621 n=1 Tax=Solanum dulcamara TaxID=45834 RepID=UPI00248677D6|nr:uncharacterized protein LOC129894621 [Solanum dulcamara]